MRFRGSHIFSVALVACSGCAHAPAPVASAITTIHIDAPRASSDPGAAVAARFVPIDATASPSAGLEPGGGVRSIAGGVRIVSLPGGGATTASERLPGASWEVTPLPDRLGGGFLIVVDRRSIWRADKWLGPARPIYAVSSATPVTRITPGLDRVYVLAKAWRAIDPTTGEPRPLGPWPATPAVLGYAAVDGWRAAAIADLRGLVATSDAGATWRPVALPIDPRGVAVQGDALEITGFDATRSEVTYALRADGQVSRAARLPAEPEPAAAHEAPGPLGANPLAAAVDDGWPLGDGTAVVARDGTLTRVRLEDGAIVESVPGAYPMRPSRCHPVPLGPGAFGFVCGEARGATVVYKFDAASSQGAMTELRRFELPRAVLASGNGALAVRGPCDARAPAEVDSAAHLYCLHAPGGSWSDLRVDGAVGDERLAVLADGRVAILSPPKGGPGSARLTIVDHGRAQSVALDFTDAWAAREHVSSETPAFASRVLSLGVWLDGVEERRPGVLGGWIEAAGTMLGYEVTLDGKVRFGALVRGEQLLPMVSGRYGLAWSDGRGGFETTDGGMTWKPVTGPAVSKVPRRMASRACGPIGCSAAGWLRIGWGAGNAAPPAYDRAFDPSVLTRGAASLQLDCDAADLPRPSSAPAGDLFGPPPAATLARDVRAVALDTVDQLGTGSSARLYAYNPRSSEWGEAMKWVVRWAWPFGGAADVRSSVASAAPPVLVEALRGPTGAVFPPGWRVLLGDDPGHALLTVSRRGARGEGIVFELQADRPPLEVRRAGGEPLGDIDAALHAGGRWYVATSSGAPAAGPFEAVLWQLDGAVARELARIPRTPLALGDRISSGRLAVRADGGALGYLVEGEPEPGRAEPTRWVAPIDLDTGAIGDIESLGSFGFADRRSFTACTNDDTGWSFDIPVEQLPNFSVWLTAPGWSGGVHGATVRVRVGPARTCVERVAGTVARSSDPFGPRSAPTASAVLVPVTVGDKRERKVLHCGVR
jgi:hypothetical protein